MRVPDSGETVISDVMPVGEVMRRWPQTVAVFLGHRMACPGCPMAPFMTVAEATRSYSRDAGALVDELRAAASASERR